MSSYLLPYQPLSGSLMLIYRWFALASNYILLPNLVPKECFLYKVVLLYMFGIYPYFGAFIYRLMTLYFAGVMGKPRNSKFLVLFILANLGPILVSIFSLVGLNNGLFIEYDKLSLKCAEKTLIGATILPMGCLYQVAFLGYYTFKTHNVFMSLNEFWEARLIFMIELVCFCGIFSVEYLSFANPLPMRDFITFILMVAAYTLMLFITLVKPMTGLYKILILACFTRKKP